MTQSNPRAGILEAARKLQEQKLAAVEKSVDTRARAGAVEAQLAEAYREDAAAYKACLDAGWTEAELKAVGIDAPARPGPGRPRSASGARRPRGGRPAAGGGLAEAQLRREAEASVALDKGDGETHVVGAHTGRGQTEIERVVAEAHPETITHP